MAALCRTALGEAAHVFRQALDVEGRVLHVVADVIGIGLGIFDALFERARRAGMRARVINGLALLEKLDGPVDVFRFRPGCERGNGERQQDA